MSYKKLSTGGELRMGQSMAKLLVTEKCNFRCEYCRATQTTSHELSLDEIERVAKYFLDAGMKRIKICGGYPGEPLLRKDILQIVEVIRGVGFEEIGMATNGHLLTKKLVERLSATGLTWLTHSIDTLVPAKYKSLYGRHLPKASLDALNGASQLQRYVICCVLLKGINDDEFHQLTSFAHERGCHMHFMEMVRNETNRSFYDKHYMSAECLKSELYDQCIEYRYHKGNSKHSYVLPTGLVTVKQTRLDLDACASCERIFISSEGKIWFCKPDTLLCDFREDRKMLASKLGMKNLIANRFSQWSESRLLERLQNGCDRMVDP